MEKVELEIAKTAVKAGMLTQPQLLKALEWENSCQNFSMNIPLANIIFEGYSWNWIKKQQYMRYVVDASEIEQIKKIIDPFRKEFNESWEQPPKQIELSSSFRQTAQLQAELKKYDIHWKMMMLTKLFYPRANDFTPILPVNTNRANTLETLCSRTHQDKILLPNIRLRNLAELLLPSIEELLQIQENIKPICHIPLSHFIMEKADIEAGLLHILLLGQIQFQHININFQWNNKTYSTLKIPIPLIPNIKAVQERCTLFLETTFQYAWYDFTLEQERTLLEYYRTKTSLGKWQQIQQIHNALRQQKFRLRPVKIMLETNLIPHIILLEGVLLHFFKLDKEKIQTLIEEYKLLEEKEKKQQTIESSATPETSQETVAQEPAVTLISPTPATRQEKTTISIGTTMQMPIQSKEKTTPSMDDAMQTLGQKFQGSQVTLAMPIIKKTQATSEKDVLQVSEEKTTYTTKVDLTEELTLLKILFEKKHIKLQDLIIALWTKKDKHEDEEITVIDILLQNSSLDEQIYKQISDQKPELISVEVIKEKNKLELDLSHMLMKYHLVTRERLQNLLSLQNTLVSLGHPTSLETILITTRILSADMIDSLINECKRRKQVKSFATEERPVPIPRLSSTVRSLAQTMRLEIPVKHKKKTGWKNLTLSMQISIIVFGIASLIGLIRLTPLLFKHKSSTKISQTQPIDTVPESIEKKQPTTPTPVAVIPTPQKEQPTSQPSGIIEIKKQTVPNIIFSLEKSQIRSTKNHIQLRAQFKTNIITTQEEFTYILKLLDPTQTKELLQREIKGTSNFQCILQYRQQFPGIYYLVLSLPPHLQKKPEQYPIEYTWKLSFHWGSARDIKEYEKQLDNTKKHIQNTLDDLNKMLDVFGKQDLKVLKNNWDRTNKQWENHIKKLQNYIQRYKNLTPYTVPNELAETTQKYMKQLESKYKDWDDYAHGLSLLQPQ
ncbi:MAG: hypothetical protein KBC30_02850 [Planctomycetes bacterium]|nr:hypothetical protein [Planctomycetota bacterium]HPY75462.1 hypothetical protein [Planctomycetota bacterium]